MRLLLDVVRKMALEEESSSYDCKNIINALKGINKNNSPDENYEKRLYNVAKPRIRNHHSDDSLLQLREPFQKIPPKHHVASREAYSEKDSHRMQRKHIKKDNNFASKLGECISSLKEISQHHMQTEIKNDNCLLKNVKNPPRSTKLTEREKRLKHFRSPQRSQVYIHKLPINSERVIVSSCTTSKTKVKIASSGSSKPVKLFHTKRVISNSILNLNNCRRNNGVPTFVKSNQEKCMSDKSWHYINTEPRKTKPMSRSSKLRTIRRPGLKMNRRQSNFISEKSHKIPMRCQVSKFSHELGIAKADKLKEEKSNSFRNVVKRIYSSLRTEKSNNIRKQYNDKSSPNIRCIQQKYLDSKLDVFLMKNSDKSQQQDSDLRKQQLNNLGKAQSTAEKSKNNTIYDQHRINMSNFICFDGRFEKPTKILKGQDKLKVTNKSSVELFKNSPLNIVYKQRSEMLKTTCLHSNLILHEKNGQKYTKCLKCSEMNYSFLKRCFSNLTDKTFKNYRHKPHDSAFAPCEYQVYVCVPGRLNQKNVEHSMLKKKMRFVSESGTKQQGKKPISDTTPSDKHLTIDKMRGSPIINDTHSSLSRVELKSGMSIRPKRKINEGGAFNNKLELSSVTDNKFQHMKQKLGETSSVPQKFKYIKVNHAFNKYQRSGSDSELINEETLRKNKPSFFRMNMEKQVQNLKSHFKHGKYTREKKTSIISINKKLQTQSYHNKNKLPSPSNGKSKSKSKLEFSQKFDDGVRGEKPSQFKIKKGMRIKHHTYEDDSNNRNIKSNGLTYNHKSKSLQQSKQVDIDFLHGKINRKKQASYLKSKRVMNEPQLQNKENYIYERKPFVFENWKQKTISPSDCDKKSPSKKHTLEKIPSPSIKSSQTNIQRSESKIHKYVQYTKANKTLALGTMRGKTIQSYQPQPESKYGITARQTMPLTASKLKNTKMKITGAASHEKSPPESKIYKNNVTAANNKKPSPDKINKSYKVSPSDKSIDLKLKKSIPKTKLTESAHTKTKNKINQLFSSNIVLQKNMSEPETPRIKDNKHIKVSNLKLLSSARTRGSRLVCKDNKNKKILPNTGSNEKKNKCKSINEVKIKSRVSTELINNKNKLKKRPTEGKIARKKNDISLSQSFSKDDRERLKSISDNIESKLSKQQTVFISKNSAEHVPKILKSSNHKTTPMPSKTNESERGIIVSRNKHELPIEKQGPQPELLGKKVDIFKNHRKSLEKQQAPVKTQIKQLKDKLVRSKRSLTKPKLDSKTQKKMSVQQTAAQIWYGKQSLIHHEQRSTSNVQHQKKNSKQDKISHKTNNLRNIATKKDYAKPLQNKKSDKIISNPSLSGFFKLKPFKVLVSRINFNSNDKYSNIAMDESHDKNKMIEKKSKVNEGKTFLKSENKHTKTKVKSVYPKSISENMVKSFNHPAPKKWQRFGLFKDKLQPKQGLLEKSQRETVLGHKKKKHELKSKYVTTLNINEQSNVNYDSGAKKTHSLFHKSQDGVQKSRSSLNGSGFQSPANVKQRTALPINEPELEINMSHTKKGPNRSSLGNIIKNKSRDTKKETIKPDILLIDKNNQKSKISQNSKQEEKLYRQNKKTIENVKLPKKLAESTYNKIEGVPGVAHTKTMSEGVLNPKLSTQISSKPRQSVKIGSDLSFNLIFFKDRSLLNRSALKVNKNRNVDDICDKIRDKEKRSPITIASEYKSQNNYLQEAPVLVKKKEQRSISHSITTKNMSPARNGNERSLVVALNTINRNRSKPRVKSERPRKAQRASSWWDKMMTLVRHSKDHFIEGLKIEIPKGEPGLKLEQLKGIQDLKEERDELDRLEKKRKKRRKKAIELLRGPMTARDYIDPGQTVEGGFESDGTKIHKQFMGTSKVDQASKTSDTTLKKSSSFLLTEKKPRASHEISISIPEVNLEVTDDKSAANEWLFSKKDSVNMSKSEKTSKKSKQSIFSRDKAKLYNDLMQEQPSKSVKTSKKSIKSIFSRNKSQLNTDMMQEPKSNQDSPEHSLHKNKRLSRSISKGKILSTRSKLQENEKMTKNIETLSTEKKKKMHNQPIRQSELKVTEKFASKRFLKSPTIGPSKQAVKIGTNFEFDVEFFKDRLNLNKIRKDYFDSSINSKMEGGKFAEAKKTLDKSNLKRKRPISLKTKDGTVTTENKKTKKKTEIKNVRGKEVGKTRAKYKKYKKGKKITSSDDFFAYGMPRLLPCDKQKVHDFMKINEYPDLYEKTSRFFVPKAAKTISSTMNECDSDASICIKAPISKNLINYAFAEKSSNTSENPDNRFHTLPINSSTMTQTNVINFQMSFDDVGIGFKERYTDASLNKLENIGQIKEENKIKRKNTCVRLLQTEKPNKFDRSTDYDNDPYLIGLDMQKKIITKAEKYSKEEPIKEKFIECVTDETYQKNRVKYGSKFKKCLGLAFNLNIKPEPQLSSEQDSNLDMTPTKLHILAGTQDKICDGMSSKMKKECFCQLSKNTMKGLNIKLKKRPLSPYKEMCEFCNKFICDPEDCRRLKDLRERKLKSICLQTNPVYIRERHLGLYECEPKFCTVHECCPYDCEKRMKIRYMRKDMREVGAQHGLTAKEEEERKKKAKEKCCCTYYLEQRRNRSRNSLVKRKDEFSLRLCKEPRSCITSRRETKENQKRFGDTVDAIILANKYAPLSKNVNTVNGNTRNKQHLLQEIGNAKISSSTAAIENYTPYEIRSDNEKLRFDIDSWSHLYSQEAIVDDNLQLYKIDDVSKPSIFLNDESQSLDSKKFEQKSDTLLEAQDKVEEKSIETGKATVCEDYHKGTEQIDQNIIRVFSLFQIDKTSSKDVESVGSPKPTDVNKNQAIKAKLSENKRNYTKVEKKEGMTVDKLIKLATIDHNKFEARDKSKTKIYCLRHCSEKCTPYMGKKYELEKKQGIKIPVRCTDKTESECLEIVIDRCDMNVKNEADIRNHIKESMRIRRLELGLSEGTEGYATLKAPKKKKEKKTFVETWGVDKGKKKKEKKRKEKEEDLAKVKDEIRKESEKIKTDSLAKITDQKEKEVRGKEGKEIDYSKEYAKKASIEKEAVKKDKEKEIESEMDTKFDTRKDTKGDKKLSKDTIGKTKIEKRDLDKTGDIEKKKETKEDLEGETKRDTLKKFFKEKDIPKDTRRQTIKRQGDIGKDAKADTKKETDKRKEETKRDVKEDKDLKEDTKRHITKVKKEIEEEIGADKKMDTIKEKVDIVKKIKNALQKWRRKDKKKDKKKKKEIEYAKRDEKKEKEYTREGTKGHAGERTNEGSQDKQKEKKISKISKRDSGKQKQTKKDKKKKDEDELSGLEKFIRWIRKTDKIPDVCDDFEKPRTIEKFEKLKETLGKRCSCLCAQCQLPPTQQCGAKIAIKPLLQRIETQMQIERLRKQRKKELTELDELGIQIKKSPRDIKPPHCTFCKLDPLPLSPPRNKMYTNVIKVTKSDRIINIVTKPSCKCDPTCQICKKTLLTKKCTCGSTICKAVATRYAEELLQKQKHNLKKCKCGSKVCEKQIKSIQSQERKKFRAQTKILMQSLKSREKDLLNREKEEANQLLLDLRAEALVSEAERQKVGKKVQTRQTGFSTDKMKAAQLERDRRMEREQTLKAFEDRERQASENVRKLTEKQAEAKNKLKHKEERKRQIERQNEKERIEREKLNQLQRKHKVRKLRKKPIEIKESRDFTALFSFMKGDITFNDMIRRVKGFKETKLERKERLLKIAYKNKKNKLLRQKREKRWKKEDNLRRKRRLEDDKYQAKKMRQFEDANDYVLISEGILDLFKLGFNMGTGFVRCTFRRIIDVPGTYRTIKDFFIEPKRCPVVLKSAFRNSGIVATFQRISARLKSLNSVKTVKNTAQRHAATRYVFNLFQRDPSKRLAKVVKSRERIDYNCSLYMGSLRKKPCLCCYDHWPSFYPHCISLINLYHSLVNVIFFMLAVLVWSPCIIGMEICRACMCCLFCGG